jgi:hypothetical protein
MANARVLISNRIGSDGSTGVGSQSQIIDLNSKNFMTWENFIFEQAYLQRQMFHARTGTNLTFRKCMFLATGQQQTDFFAVTHAPGVTRNILFTQCFAAGLAYQSFWNDNLNNAGLGAHMTYNFTIDRCFGVGANLSNPSNYGFGYQGVYVVNSYNCYLHLYRLWYRWCRYMLNRRRSRKKPIFYFYRKMIHFQSIRYRVLDIGIGFEFV